MQCKDIPDQPILDFIAKVERGETFWYPDKVQRKHYGDKVAHSTATLFEGFENSVFNAMPAGTPFKLAKAKMASMIRRSLIDGCTCGCRGDFRIATSPPPVV